MYFFSKIWIFLERREYKIKIPLTSLINWEHKILCRIRNKEVFCLVKQNTVARTYCRRIYDSAKYSSIRYLRCQIRLYRQDRKNMLLNFRRWFHIYLANVLYLFQSTIKVSRSPVSTTLDTFEINYIYYYFGMYASDISILTTYHSKIFVKKNTCFNFQL